MTVKSEGERPTGRIEELYFEAVFRVESEAGQ